MTSIITATSATIRGRVPAESGLLTPEVPALTNARRRAAERRATPPVITHAAITLITATPRRA